MQSSCVCESTQTLGWLCKTEMGVQDSLSSAPSMDILNRGSHSEPDQSLSCSTRCSLLASTVVGRTPQGPSLLEQRIQATIACHQHTKPEERGYGGLACSKYRDQTELFPEQGTGHTDISCGHIGTHTQALPRTCSHMSTQGHPPTCAGKGREQGITNSRSYSLPSSQGAAPASLFTVFLTITPTTWCRPEPGAGRRPMCIFWEHPLWDPPPSKVTLT